MGLLQSPKSRTEGVATRTFLTLKTEWGTPVFLELRQKSWDERFDDFLHSSFKCIVFTKSPVPGALFGYGQLAGDDGRQLMGRDTWADGAIVLAHRQGGGDGPVSPESRIAAPLATDNLKSCYRSYSIDSQNSIATK